MANTVYIVCENSYDYDDNRYYSTDGVDPIKTFIHKEDAFKYAAELNRSFAYANRIMDYVDEDVDRDWDNLWKQICAILQIENNKETKPENSYDFKLPENISDDMVDAILNKLELDFYLVRETDLE